MYFWATTLLNRTPKQFWKMTLVELDTLIGLYREANDPEGKYRWTGSKSQRASNVIYAESLIPLLENGSKP
jgi:hypothetical protein